MFCNYVFNLDTDDGVGMPSLWEEESVSEAESETDDSLLRFDGTDPTTQLNEMLHAIQTNLLVNSNALDVFIWLCIVKSILKTAVLCIINW